MNHDYFDSKTCGCGGRPFCPICEGGLACCRACGLYEGSLTTDCSGYECFKEKSDEVYAGKIDFRDGKWVDGVTIHMQHAYSKDADEPVVIGQRWDYKAPPAGVARETIPIQRYPYF